MNDLIQTEDSEVSLGITELGLVSEETKGNNGPKTEGSVLPLRLT